MVVRLFVFNGSRAIFKATLIRILGWIEQFSIKDKKVIKVFVNIKIYL